MAKNTKPCTGIVLSGGGARGAYEVGVVSGIMQILRQQGHKGPPFQVFAGTSVGAMNVSYLASYAHHSDLNVSGLASLWRKADLGEHLQIQPTRLFGAQGLRRRLGLSTESKWASKRGGRSLLNPLPIERLIRDSIHWDRLHGNIDESLIRGLILTALRVDTGQTIMFSELCPKTEFRPTNNPRRISRNVRIRTDHIMASASIPFAYPPRWIEDAYYCDGSMRFNTPIAPAIRAGADKLLIISLLKIKERTEIEQDAPTQPPFPGMLMLAGKVLNALLADPLTYDLQILRRLNRLLEVLDEALTEEEMTRVDQTMVELRGKPYRKIEPLVFAPTQDIGRMAGLHLRLHKQELDLNRMGAWLLGRASKDQATWEADLASYFLYDGGFATKLIDLGRQDALNREDDVRAFFSS